MYFTGSPFESFFGSAFESAGLDPLFSVAGSPTAKAGSSKSAAHSATRDQLDLGTLCIRDDRLSVAQLSFGRRVRCVVFFAAWREKATGFYLQTAKAPVVCKRIRILFPPATRPDRRLSMRDAAP